MNKALEKSRVLFLDTGAVVRLLQMHPDYYPVVSSVLDFAYENNLTVLVSNVTLFEISKKAFAAGEVAVKAAEFAAKNLSTEESMRLATAYVCGADCILTDCVKFRDMTDIPAVLLDEVE